MRIVVHSDIPQDENLRQQWNNLVQRSESPQVFYTHEWASAVAFAYSGSLRPLLILGYESDDLVGIASLATAVDNPSLHFLAHANADYCDFVSAPQQRAEFMNEVLEELNKRNIRSLIFANLPAGSETARTLSLCQNHGYHFFHRPAYQCAQIVLGKGSERQAVQQAVRKRKAFRYSLNVLSRKGVVSFEHHQDWKPVHELFTEFAQAHIARFLAQRKISNLESPERQNFLIDLAARLSQESWLRFSCMKLGERAVAWNYGFHFAGSWFYYQPTFVSDLQEFSPGVCLLSKIIEDACDDPDTQMVDLGLGEEGYKERFANAQRSTIHVEISKSMMRRSGAAIRYYAATSIKSVPALESGVRAGLRVISRVSRYARPAQS